MGKTIWLCEMEALSATGVCGLQTPPGQLSYQMAVKMFMRRHMYEQAWSQFHKTTNGYCCCQIQEVLLHFSNIFKMQTKLEPVNQSVWVRSFWCGQSGVHLCVCVWGGGELYSCYIHDPSLQIYQTLCRTYSARLAPSYFYGRTMPCNYISCSVAWLL